MAMRFGERGAGVAVGSGLDGGFAAAFGKSPPVLAARQRLVAIVQKETASRRMRGVCVEELFGKSLGFGNACGALLSALRLSGRDSQALAALHVERFLKLCGQVGAIGNLVDIGQT